jgi:acyl carrier protein
LASANVTESDIQEWCIAYLTRTADNPGIAIGPEARFTELGLDSATSAYFIVELEEWLGTELAPELVFEYPTIAELARHVASGQGGAADAGGG